MDKELIEVLHYTQNKLLKIKEILINMDIWEAVESKVKELE